LQHTSGLYTVEMQSINIPLPSPMTINFSDTPNLEDATVSSNIATDRVQRMEESLDVINEDEERWSSEINYYEHGQYGRSNLDVTWCGSASNLKD